MSCRVEGPCQHPEARGHASGSAADEGGEAGGGQSAPDPLLPGRLVSAQVGTETRTKRHDEPSALTAPRDLLFQDHARGAGEESGGLGSLG